MTDTRRVTPRDMSEDEKVGDMLGFVVGSKVKPRGLDGPEMVVLMGWKDRTVEVAWFLSDGRERRSVWPDDALDLVQPPQVPVQFNVEELVRANVALAAQGESARMELDQKKQALVEFSSKWTTAVNTLRPLSPKISPELEVHIAARYAVEAYETMKREANEQLERLSKRLKDAGL